MINSVIDRRIYASVSWGCLPRDWRETTRDSHYYLIVNVCFVYFSLQERGVLMALPVNLFTPAARLQTSRTTMKSWGCPARPHRRTSRRRTTRSGMILCCTWSMCRIVTRGVWGSEKLRFQSDATFFSPLIHSLTFHLSRWQKSTTQTPTQMTQRPRRSLPSWLKPTRYSRKLIRSVDDGGVCDRQHQTCSPVSVCWKVLSDEVKRKQYDTYGPEGFDPNRGRAGQQQYYKAGGATLDPEELFRKIFGEFTGGFGNINSIFEQRPEVRAPSLHQCTSHTQSHSFKSLS